MRRARVVVSGRVQGVFYRASCAREAEARGLTGWVRNRPGGDVEAVFEGLDAQVEAMIAWCREGPPAARVETIEIRDEPPEGERGFLVGR
jgi:acylphosphatase